MGHVHTEPRRLGEHLDSGVLALLVGAVHLIAVVGLGLTAWQGNKKAVHLAAAGRGPDLRTRHNHALSTP